MERKKSNNFRPKERPGRTARTEDEELAALAKALGHPARASIMRHLLSKGECICGDIVDRLPLAQATVSQHLKVLKGAGWITGEVDGPRVCYCARPGTLARFVALLQGLEPKKKGKKKGANYEEGHSRRSARTLRPDC